MNCWNNGKPAAEPVPTQSLRLRRRPEFLHRPARRERRRFQEMPSCGTPGMSDAVVCGHCGYTGKTLHRSERTANAGVMLDGNRSRQALRLCWLPYLVLWHGMDTAGGYSKFPCTHRFF